MSYFFKQFSKIVLVLLSVIIILISGYFILNPINSTKNLILFNPFLNKPTISYVLIDNNYSIQTNCNKLFGATVTYSSNDKYLGVVKEDFIISKGNKIKIGISCINGSFTYFNISMPSYIEFD